MELRSNPGPNGFVDSYGIWLLVKKVCHLGSSRARFRYITDYLASNDRGLSLDAFLVLLRKQDTLVQDNFADAAHPGYLSFDLLLKIRLINGIDPVFYARPIERLMDDFPDATSAQAIGIIRSYAQERGSSSVPLTTSGTKALVASIPAVGKAPLSGPSLPPSHFTPDQKKEWCSKKPCPVATLGMCPRCWSFGDCDPRLNCHSASECKAQRAVVSATLAAKRGKGSGRYGGKSGGKALVAEVSVPSSPPPSVASSAAPPPMTPAMLYDMMCSEYESRSQAGSARPGQLAILITTVLLSDMELLLLWEHHADDPADIGVVDAVEGALHGGADSPVIVPWGPGWTGDGEFWPSSPVHTDPSGEASDDVLSDGAESPLPAGYTPASDVPGADALTDEELSSPLSLMVGIIF